MSKSKKTKEALAPTCNFRKAVEDTPDVVNGYCFGLQALENVDKSAVTLKDSRKVDGSLNIDKETKLLYPNEPRWDYAIGYDDKVFLWRCILPIPQTSLKWRKKKNGCKNG